MKPVATTSQTKQYPSVLLIAPAFVAGVQLLPPRCLLPAVCTYHLSGTTGKMEIGKQPSVGMVGQWLY